MKRTPLVRKRRKRRVAPPDDRRCTWIHVRAAGNSRCTKRRTVYLDEVEGYCHEHADRVADDLVGRRVKERDGRCVSCGGAPEQWAHIHSRGARYIRWDTETAGIGNTVSLCARCHYRYTNAPAAWDVFVEANYPGLWTRLIHAEIAGEASGCKVDVAAIIRAEREMAA